jgi:hypothetical protein
MKVLKWIVLILIGLVVIFALVGFLLPAEYKVERSTVVKAAPAQIFPFVNELPNWQLWMAWYEKDPEMEITYTGPTSGVGATSAWNSKTEGKGEMVVQEMIPDQLVRYRLSFPGFEPSTGQIALEAVEDGTRVTWSDGGNLGGNPFIRYFGLMLDSMIGKDFETGLAKLKSIAEAKAAEAENEVDTQAEGPATAADPDQE